MPLYAHRCTECDHTFDDWRPMSQADQTVMCPVCATTTYRDFTAEKAGNHLDREYAKPIEMQSVAFTFPEEIENFRRKHPDIEIGTDPSQDNYGVPVARSRSEKLRILQEVGFQEKN